MNWIKQLSSIECHWEVNLIILLSMILFGYKQLQQKPVNLFDFGFCCVVAGANLIMLYVKTK